MTLYWQVIEHNEWEAERWNHYFEDGPGVREALERAVEKTPDLRGPMHRELSDDAMLALSDLDGGCYMAPHAFFWLTKIAELDAATGEDLYKGKIRDYGESMVETVPADEGEVRHTATSLFAARCTRCGAMATELASQDEAIAWLIAHTDLCFGDRPS